MPRRRGSLAAGFAAAVLLGAVLLTVEAPDVEAALMRLAEFVARLGGPAGFLLFVAAFVLCALLLVPSSLLSLVGGLVYGVAGIPVSWLCMMLTAAIAFPLARAGLADAVTWAVRNRPVLRTLMAVVGEEGWRTVLLVRVSGFVPFGLQNYVLGVTPVSYGPYLFASTVGILPSILVYAGIGALGQASLRSGGLGAPQLVLLGLGVAASLTLIGLTALKVKRRLGVPGAS